MAELFSMSGFSLVSTALKSTHAVGKVEKIMGNEVWLILLSTAEESVNAFDAIFGSNETSRSLSSIISLVRKELLQDPRFEAAGKSKVASWTALTKALTAFACLQNVSSEMMSCNPWAFIEFLFDPHRPLGLGSYQT